MEKIEKLRSFLAITPEDSFLNHALALEYIKLGDDQEAKRLFIEILGRDPGYIGSYLHLGHVFERSGELESAIKSYTKGMKEAKEKGDMHAYGELQAALEDITD